VGLVKYHDLFGLGFSCAAGFLGVHLSGSGVINVASRRVAGRKWESKTFCLTLICVWESKEHLCF